MDGHEFDIFVFVVEIHAVVAVVVAAAYAAAQDVVGVIAVVTAANVVAAVDEDGVGASDAEWIEGMLVVVGGGVGGIENLVVAE